MNSCEEEEEEEGFAAWGWLVHFVIQSRTSSCHFNECFGFKTQWFSVLNIASLLGTLLSVQTSKEYTPVVEGLWRPLILLTPLIDSLKSIAYDGGYTFWPVNDELRSLPILNKVGGIVILIHRSLFPWCTKELSLAIHVEPVPLFHRNKAPPSNNTRSKYWRSHHDYYKPHHLKDPPNQSLKLPSKRMSLNPINLN